MRCTLITSYVANLEGDIMSIFKNKTLMITGGTGSFGNAVLNGFLETDIKEIRIFSRDEKKQDDMRHEFQAKMPEASNKIKFFIGDVRDLASVKNAMHGVDYIFHAAALKQVPSCEFFPIEAVKTNVLGTENVLTAAIEEGVKSVISKPGITKGEHWHNSKWEFFIVVSGHGLIQERKIGTDEVIEFEVSGEKIEAIHMLPGYTHNIINLSETENLVTVMWANEQFDPKHPDTFFEKVEEK